MKRPKLLAALAVAQWLLVATFFYGASVIVGMGLMATVHDPNAAASIFLGPISCLLFMVACYMAGRGIWKQRFWGQWTALVVLGISVAVLSYVWYDDDWDSDFLPVLIPFAVLFIIHLLPATWRAFRSAKLDSPTSTI